MDLRFPPERFYQCAQASCLARAILMPRHEMNRLIKMGYGIEDISEIFCVPEVQVALRIEDIRKLKGAS